MSSTEHLQTRPRAGTLALFRNTCATSKSQGLGSWPRSCVNAASGSWTNSAGGLPRASQALNTLRLTSRLPLLDASQRSGQPSGHSKTESVKKPRRRH